MSVRVLTDSAAALPDGLIAEWRVGVVPLALSIAGTPYTDGDITDDEVLARLSEGVTTSAPSPGAFVTAIDRALAVLQTDGAVVITVASSVSATHDSARLGARTYGERVRVVDSMGASGSQALVVLAAARCAAKNGSLEEVAGVAETVAQQVRLIGTLPSLDRLATGGRVPVIAARAGDFFGVQPLFEMRAARIGPLRPAFSREAAMNRMVRNWRASRVEGKVAEVVALHASAQQDAEQLLALVRQETDPALALVSRFGAVMMAQTGPGVLGLAWRWRDPRDRY